MFPDFPDYLSEAEETRRRQELVVRIATVGLNAGEAVPAWLMQMATDYRANRLRFAELRAAISNGTEMGEAA